MRRLCRQILITLLLLICCQAIYAQTSQTATGSLTVLGRAKSGSGILPLRKIRFYLFRGGRDANKNLIDKFKAANTVSPDCFYCQQKASPELLAWLEKENCESIYCREITAEDIAAVPEFQTAYKKGLSKMKKKPDLARKWLVTYLEPGFRTGFYDARKVFVKQFEKDIVQTAMTDNARDPKGYFTNVPLGTSVEKFVYTNLLPIEIGGKSYVWVCEAEIGKDKSTVVLDTDVAGCVNQLGAAVGSCSARAMRLPALEARLQGQPLGALVHTQIEAADLAPLSPIDDVRATAAYRRDATATLLRRALGALTSQENAGPPQVFLSPAGVGLGVARTWGCS